MVVFVVISTLVSLSDAAVAGNGQPFLVWGAGLTVWVWLFAQYSTSHIGVRSDELLFVDVLVERSVRASEIEQVHGDDGVGVELRSGDKVGSFAYGPSLPQSFRPYRRYLQVAREIEHWREGVADVSSAVRDRSHGVRWRLRRRSLLALLAAAISSYAWMLVLWLLAAPLRMTFGIPE